MFFIETILLIVSLLNINKCIDCLETSTGDDIILRTEAAVRNTTNKLFAALKLKRSEPKLSQYLIINKVFASLTLQDHSSLNEIVNISRVNNLSSGSYAFMTAINDLLNSDTEELEENEINKAPKEKDDVVQIVNSFLHRLKEAKELYEIHTYDKVNENLVKVLKEANNENITRQDWQDENYLGNENSTGDMDFWQPSGRRIYKGERTKIKYYPFIASIQMFNIFQCGGSIIKSDLIITASSCLQLAWNNRFYRENPAFLSVRVGSSFYNGGGEVIPVLEVYFHPGYSPKTLRNNLCILRLTRKIRFSWRSRRRVRKIEIDRHDNALPFNTPGITILGWGAKGRSNIVRDPWKNILSFAVLDVYPLKDCQDIYSKEYVTQKHFCAGFMSKGGGACNRDIGGPGIDEGLLMGVVSFGSPVCGAPDAPTVFTKLGYYADWIDSIMEQDVPYSKKKTTLAPPKSPYPLRINHTPPKSTTYKLPPPGKMKPIPINEAENALRMFDEDLFAEFLKTMFEGKAIADNQDTLKENPQKVTGKKQKKYEKKKPQDAFKEADYQDGFEDTITKDKMSKKRQNKKQRGSRVSKKRQNKKRGKQQNALKEVTSPFIDYENPPYEDDIKEEIVKEEIAKAVNKKHKKRKHQNVVQELTSPFIDDETPPTTKLIEYEAEGVESVTHSDYSNKYTILDQVEVDQEISDRSDISGLMDNIDLEKIVKEKRGQDQQSQEMIKTRQQKSLVEPTVFEEVDSSNFNGKNESVLTLLYLSDENKDKDDIMSGEGVPGDLGLSILDDSFKDFTRSKGKQDLYNVLPEKELYEILSELIDDEMRNNKTR